MSKKQSPETVCDENTEHKIRSKDINWPFSLSPGEEIWRDLSPELQKRNYILRPRYRLGWVGSWIGVQQSDEETFTAEDTMELPNPVVMDGIYTLGLEYSQVLLKIHDFNSDGVELDVLRFFSSDPLKSDPRNHCVQLIEEFTLSAPADTPRWKGINSVPILVEPLLRDWRLPAPVLAVEALSFVKQTLEGLAFMHSHNVAHRDIRPSNIMVDPRPMFPDGFHPLGNWVDPSFTSKYLESGRYHDQVEVAVKYYYIDCEISSKFPSYEGRQLVQWIGGTVKNLPELAQDPLAFYDPFKADVYALGVLFQDLYGNSLPYLCSLFSSMTNSNPEERPTAEGSFKTFKQRTDHLSRARLLGSVPDPAISNTEHPSKWPAKLRARYMRRVVKCLIHNYGRSI